MRYAAVISYFGANYVGWQRQLNGLSVQEALEKAMEKAFGQEVAATASGRTDAGVHALAQVVHFDVETSIPTDKIPFAVNSYLPSDISMLSCEVAPDDFNARFSAKR
ncbi:MAG: tRNA pseudouridine(38-40) synthase TruA, partial [Clostridia bacterium]|nr:tRNA pseudouridine(38-40) synthase TruA [Clostridia bacterium]